MKHEGQQCINTNRINILSFRKSCDSGFDVFCIRKHPTIYNSPILVVQWSFNAIAMLQSKITTSRFRHYAWKSRPSSNHVSIIMTRASRKHHSIAKHSSSKPPSLALSSGAAPCQPHSVSSTSIASSSSFAKTGTRFSVA